MKVIDGDHLKSILQEYVKREEAYAESGDFFDNLISTCVAAGLLEAIHSIEEEPSVQQEYKPVKIKDFAKTMSENTIYNFMTWTCEALDLMERQGFVICKKTM